MLILISRMHENGNKHYSYNFIDDETGKVSNWTTRELHNEMLKGRKFIGIYRTSASVRLNPYYYNIGILGESNADGIIHYSILKRYVYKFHKTIQVSDTFGMKHTFKEETLIQLIKEGKIKISGAKLKNNDTLKFIQEIPTEIINQN